MAAAIEIRGLRKSYGSVEAVRGIDLEVQEGEVFALLGPNGAGKTTTVEILEGHRKRDGGEVTVLGFDPGKNERALRARVGIVLQETGVERFLTVAEVVEMYRGYYPRPLPLDDIIELVGLTDKRNERVLRLSGGQQRRLDVAVGLSGDPDLLFLDEPTTGFDPAARRGAWQMVSNLRDLGKTVFLTTHYMDEAQKLADRVAIIVDGAIVAEGPPDELDNGADEAAISFELPSQASLPDALRKVASRRGSGFEIRTREEIEVLRTLTNWAAETGTEIVGLTVTRPSLEDVYLQITKTTSSGGAA